MRKESALRALLLGCALSVVLVLVLACGSTPAAIPVDVSTLPPATEPPASPGPPAASFTPSPSRPAANLTPSPGAPIPSTPEMTGAAETATPEPSASPSQAGSTTAPTAPPTRVTATGTPRQSPAPAGELALGMRIYDSSFVPALMRPGDIVGTGFKRGVDQAEALLGLVPQENRMLMFASLEGLEGVLDSLDLPIAYVGYDLERWEATGQAEQQDPVAAMKQAQEIAHARGLQLVAGPSRYFNEQYGTQLAPYIDVYMPQAKFYQARLSPDEYRQTLRDLILSLRQANPRMQVFLDLSPSPKGVLMTPAQMADSVNLVRDVIDGVWVTYNPRESETVAQFAGLLRQ